MKRGKLIYTTGKGAHPLERTLFKYVHPVWIVDSKGSWTSGELIQTYTPLSVGEPVYYVYGMGDFLRLFKECEQ